jgi:4,5-dihydroxyphthalate decarboxylase
MATKPTLKVLLGEYDKTKAIRDGELKPQLCDLDIAPISVAQHGFPALCREGAFDLAEVAIMTFLIAREHGKPYALLPYVMNGGFHHGSLWYRTALGDLQPKDLEGKRVGLRSWTQTTPTWVRGYLQNDYGVDLWKIKWVTFEDAHVAEYVEPEGITRAPEKAKLNDMLLNGELDAALVGLGAPDDPRIRRLIADPKAAAREWYARNQAVPINHMICVKKDLLAARPDIVREYFDLLGKSRDLAGGSKVQDGVNLQPTGLANVRNSLALAVEYGVQQKLLRKPVTVDELFDEVTASLGA